MTKWHRELMRRLQEAGITVTNFEQRSSSILIDCMQGLRTHRYYVGISPSDQRALDNAFHDIKRALRQPEISNA